MSTLDEPRPQELPDAKAAVTPDPPNAAIPIEPRQLTGAAAAYNGTGRRKRHWKTTRVPKKLTPRVAKAIRMIASGIERSKVCDQTGVDRVYLSRVLAAPIGQQELTRVAALLEESFVSHAGAATAGIATPTQSEVNAEVDAAQLEAIRELRNIMKSSTSDNARAIAAKELLDLAQAKKKYAQTSQPDDGTPIDPTDVGALAATMMDMRKILSPVPAKSDDAVTAPHDDHNHNGDTTTDVEDGAGQPAPEIDPDIPEESA